MKITFNGVEMPEGVKVRTYYTSVLPPIEVQKVKIHGRAGMFNLAKTIGERQINVEFLILDTSEEGYRQKIRELARWLFTDEPVKFQIDSDPNFYYMAMVEGESAIEEQTDEIGVVNVTFTASQPLAISTTQYYVPLNQVTAAQFNNDGDVEAAPLIEINFGNNSSFVELERVQMLPDNEGEPTIVGDRKTLVIGSAVRYGEISQEQLFAAFTPIFNDPMNNLDTWTHLPNNTYFNPFRNDDGRVKSQFELITETLSGSSQTGFGLQTGTPPNYNDDHYGTGDTDGQMTGAAAERTLTTALEDFAVEFDITYFNQFLNGVSKFEAYLFGEDGSEIAKINYGDGFIGQCNPQLWVRFSDSDPYSSDTESIMGYTGQSAGVRIVKNRGNRYYYHKNGLIRIRFARRLNNWRLWIATIDPSDGGFQRALNQDLFEFEDSLGILNYEKLKKIRITVSRRWTSSFALAPQAFVVHSCRVEKSNIRDYDPVLHRPYLFKSGDKLVIDMNKAQIWLNGEEFYQYFDPSTNFWRLKKGTNRVGLYSNSGSISDAKLYLNERFL